VSLMVAHSLANLTYENILIIQAASLGIATLEVLR
jgi:hypothetical protein